MVGMVLKFWRQSFVNFGRYCGKREGMTKSSPLPLWSVAGHSRCQNIKKQLLVNFTFCLVSPSLFQPAWQLQFEIRNSSILAKPLRSSPTGTVTPLAQPCASAPSSRPTSAEPWALAAAGSAIKFEPLAFSKYLSQLASVASEVAPVICSYR